MINKGVLTWDNRILTWDNLQRRGFTGPGICPLCWSNEESVEHLFSFCWVWKSAAEFFVDYFHINVSISGISVADIVYGWVDKIPKSSSIFLLLFNLLWMVWKAHNSAVFEGKYRNIQSIIQQTLLSVHSPVHGAVTKKCRSRNIGSTPIKIFPCGFFDGASINRIAGAGLCIFLMTPTTWKSCWGWDLAQIPRQSCSVSGHSCIYLI